MKRIPDSPEWEPVLQPGQQRWQMDAVMFDRGMRDIDETQDEARAERRAH